MLHGPIASGSPQALSGLHQSMIQAILKRAFTVLAVQISNVNRDGRSSQDAGIIN